ncbi:MAG: trypsin-like peptidase domain-containing protein [Planctomycetales bacterium]|nr:trypsin-like peptidase domain-containing protein [Planctomycetales bacterium]
MPAGRKPHYRALTRIALFVVAVLSSTAGTNAQDESPIAQIESAIQQIVERTSPSVVAIVRGRTSENESSEFTAYEYGTGVAIDEQGFVLTNFHLIGDPAEDEFGVWHDRRFYPAKVLAADPWTDLAVLQVDGAKFASIEIETVELNSNAPNVRPGQVVVTLGNPYQIARTGQVASAWGTTNGASRLLITQDGGTVFKYGGLIQTDARLRLSSSGGPLLNLDGKMVGIVTSIKAFEGFEAQSSCAIAMTKDIRRVIDELKSGHEPEFGFLGIDPEPNAVAIADENTIGVKINQVLPKTPAQSAGLLAGDIVTRMDGVSLTSVEDFLFRLGTSAAGSTITVSVQRMDPILRRTREFQRQCVLTKRFVAHQRAAYSTAEKFKWRGMQVDYFSAVRDRSELLVGPPQPCVRVTSVDKDSAAWMAGVRASDLVAELNSQPTADPATFENIAMNATGDAALRIVDRGEVIIAGSAAH